MLAVTFGHMPRFGGHAGSVFARMGRYRLLAEVDLHQRVTGMQLKLLTNVLMRYRVVMLLGTARDSRC